ncbi:SRPBCC family protein [Kutzneria sp. NPDC052558]|uniref:SRPBCC family protein n=1 Tax=Kutzneria sp. NPDC052558 TaxID=3364121 RepID=UPI0037C97098
MGIQRVDARGHTTASPATVHALLRDGSTWPSWSRIEKFDLERAGAGGGESVGAIRNFRTGRYLMREQVVEIVPDRRFSYALLSGLALRGYRADVDLTPAGGGTDIRWSSSFRARVPGTGWLYRLALQRMTEAFVQDLARATTTPT